MKDRIDSDCRPVRDPMFFITCTPDPDWVPNQNYGYLYGQNLYIHPNTAHIFLKVLDSGDLQTLRKIVLKYRREGQGR